MKLDPEAPTSLNSRLGLMCLKRLAATCAAACWQKSPYFYFKVSPEKQYHIPYWCCVALRGITTHRRQVSGASLFGMNLLSLLWPIEQKWSSNQENRPSGKNKTKKSSCFTGWLTPFRPSLRAGWSQRRLGALHDKRWRRQKVVCRADMKRRLSYWNWRSSGRRTQTSRPEGTLFQHVWAVKGKYPAQRATFVFSILLPLAAAYCRSAHFSALKSTLCGVWVCALACACVSLQWIPRKL